MIEPTMIQPTLCPECRYEIPWNSPIGLCPVCLLKTTMGFVCDSVATDRNDLDSTIQRDTNPSSAVTRNARSDESVHRRRSEPTLQRFGDFELYEEIARGGMGVVYRARQIRLNRCVALKMIRAGKFSSDADIQRLRVEAEAAAQLDHPGIVPVFEIGEHEGLHFFTMAFVDGKPLSARLIDGPLPSRDAAALVKTVCLAVQYAHEQGVIHRDLKPSNILIDATGQPRVTDFGLAKRIQVDDAMTVTGEILGTPSFMPPEQARGLAGQIGPASDVYSLGAVLYASLTGSPPFQAASPIEILRQVIEQDPVSPRQWNSSIPRDLETICLKCLEKDASRRYLSARAIAEDLDRFLSGYAIAAHPISSLERLWRWSCRRPELSLSMIALLLLLTTGVLTLLHLQRRHIQSEMQVRVEGIAKQIETAKFSELSQLIAAISPFSDRELVDRSIAGRLAQAESSDQSIRLAVAQGVVRQHLDPEIWRTWLNLPLEDLLVVTRISEPLFQPLVVDLENELSKPNGDLQDDSKRLRAICLWLNAQKWLSERNPGVTHRHFAEIRDKGESYRLARLDWNQTTNTVLQELFESPGEFKAAEELLRPAIAFLKQPLKERIVSELTSSPQRNIAISLLGELLQDSPEDLAELACLVDVQTVNLVARHVDRQTNVLIPALVSELNRPEFEFTESGANWPDERRIALATKINLKSSATARRRAMAAAWLYRLGQSDLTWPRLRLAEDSTLRYLILDRIPMLSSSAEALILRLETSLPLVEGGSNELTLRSWCETPYWSVPERISELHMVILLVGEMAKRGHVDIPQQDRLRPLLSQLYCHHPDSGIHSSCEWTLNRLGQQELVERIHQTLKRSLVAGERSWYVTNDGATLAVFRGPITYRAGSDWTDPDRLANQVVDAVTAEVSQIDQEASLVRQIDRDFAIGLKEVSFQEFLLFDPQFHQRINQVISPTVKHPANRINWYLAAQYCNWLSQREGLPSSEWCFVPNNEGRFAEGMRLADDYLHRTGYRMPTEVEWEYACRAGTSTPRFFGNAHELMPQYVWFRDNSREKVLSIPGTLKPNDRGLFDVFGNVIEWCVDPYEGRPGLRPGVIPDWERGTLVDAEAWRVLRGGHLYAEENNIRASDLWTFRPLVSDGHYGLRLARTLKTYDSPAPVSQTRD